MASPSEKRCCFLISMPQLADPNFFQTTSLLSEFTSEGAMGVVLNRPLGIPMSQLVHEGAPIESPPDLQTFWGGPVQNERGFVVHENEAYAEEGAEIEKGLYLTGSSEILRKLIQEQAESKASRFRLFLGYAGWGPGQLEKEISDSSWITAPLNRELIFDTTPKTLWTRSIATLGIDPNALTSVPQGEAN